MPNQFTVGNKTKQEMVADVLRSLNFLHDNPPADWKNRVEQALNRQGVQVHYTTIYESRKKEMRKLREQRAQQPPPKVNPDPQPVKKEETMDRQPVAERNHAAPTSGAPVSTASQPQKTVAEKLTVADALAIKNFAKKYGGLGGLTEAVKVVAELYAD